MDGARERPLPIATRPAAWLASVGVKKTPSHTTRPGSHKSRRTRPEPRTSGSHYPSGTTVYGFDLDHEDWSGQTCAAVPGWGVCTMIKGVFAVSVAATLGLATLPVEISAKEFGGHASHRAFGHRLHSGLVADYALGDEPVGFVSTSQPLSPVISPSTALSCHHSQEIITVPSEDGGDRQIKITRC